MPSGAHLTKPTETQKGAGIPALGFPVVVMVQNNLTEEPAEEVEPLPLSGQPNRHLSDFSTRCLFEPAALATAQGSEL